MAIEEDKQEAVLEAQAPLHGDVLESILSHLPLINLVPASRVSKAWRRAVASSLCNSPRAKPWLFLYIQSRRNPSLITTHAYDPNSQLWMDVTTHTSDDNHVFPLRCSHLNLLYVLSSSKFAFSFDPLNVTWHNPDPPLVWRLDPVVAIIGSRVVVAGGTAEFEDDPLAVEMYDLTSRRWEMCQSMPAILKGSAATTWLSVAVSNERLLVLEKASGAVCMFDPETSTWEGPFDLRHPGPSVFYSVIASCSEDHVVLVGLMGEATGTDNIVQGIGLWELDCESETFDCKVIGRMPGEMVEKLVNADCSPLSSIGVSTAGNLIYIYNPSNPEAIMFCEFTNGVARGWGHIHNSIVDDRNRMERFELTCSRVGIDDLQRALTSGNRRITVKYAGN
ncbi:PREDICTED: F-box/kelch-repeat protein At1g23390-like [Nelumbo nucifera]|nr:PREDICTED: F-box/kelch-repeat protein At1g23390-like [Nelumbo nucifera]